MWTKWPRGSYVHRKIGETRKSVNDMGRIGNRKPVQMFLYPHSRHRRFGLAKCAQEQAMDLAHVVFCSELEQTPR
jgi:hypothetical protein